MTFRDDVAFEFDDPVTLPTHVGNERVEPRVALTQLTRYRLKKMSGRRIVMVGFDDALRLSDVPISLFLALLQGDWRPRLAVPALVAALFALALGVVVEPTHVPLLGFLSVVSVLWMSASASLLSIAGEREVFDHERQLFLSVPHFLLAKFLVTVVVAVSQSLLFFGSLWLSRTALGRQSFHAPAWAVAILSVTSTAGASLGLCLSALAGRKKETATFLLPLVMIAQLVFSVPVASPDAARDSVKLAYTKFHWAEKQVWLAAGISLLTISQPADMALRSWSYDPPDEQVNARLTPLGGSPHCWVGQMFFCS